MERTQGPRQPAEQAQGEEWGIAHLLWKLMLYKYTWQVCTLFLYKCSFAEQHVAPVAVPMGPSSYFKQTLDKANSSISLLITVLI